MLAQLVQSAALTGRRSAVRTRYVLLNSHIDLKKNQYAGFVVFVDQAFLFVKTNINKKHPWMKRAIHGCFNDVL
jgi:hypothetical protein